MNEKLRNKLANLLGFYYNPRTKNWERFEFVGFLRPAEISLNHPIHPTTDIHMLTALIETLEESISK
jgi:hypothetical protein